MCDIIFGNYTTDEEYILYVLIRASLKNSSVTDMNTTLNKDIYYYILLLQSIRNVRINKRIFDMLCGLYMAHVVSRGYRVPWQT